MPSHIQQPVLFLRRRSLIPFGLAIAMSSHVHAEILRFDGNAVSNVSNYVINATEWADYVGGSGTFASANQGGRLFWRGTSGDGQYLRFDLSSLNGLSLVDPVTVTLQNGNTTWGGGVGGSFIATANGPWTAGAGQAVPGATAIVNAVNPSGSVGSGAAVSWSIGLSTFQNFVNNPSSFNGLAIIGGAASQLHFNNPMSPFLTARAGTLSPLPNVIVADTGTSTWNANNYSFLASNQFSATANTLRITGNLIDELSGAGTLSIFQGGTVEVDQLGNSNYLMALDGTTIHTGGRLTSDGYSSLRNLTLSGGELTSTNTDISLGGWSLAENIIVNGATTSTISAQQVSLEQGVIDVEAGATLVFSGSTSPSGSLTKNGAGLMQITARQSFTGGTTVQAGTLELQGQSAGNGWLRGLVMVNPGATLLFTGGDGSGFGWNQRASQLVINGGTFAAPGGNHFGYGGSVPMLVELNDGGTISGNGQWNGDGLLSFRSSGDSTNVIDGSWVLRTDNGANHTFTVDDGAASVDLQVSADLIDSTQVIAWSSKSSITKDGEGTMVLSGNNSYMGDTTVLAGTLSIASPMLNDQALVILGENAKIDLNFVGTDVVDSIQILGVGTLPAGTYDASHPTYGQYFTGTGSLTLDVPNSTWISQIDGVWSEATNWLNGVVPIGHDALASFQGANGVTVTLDSSRIMGHLAFDVADYVLAGTGALTFSAANTPSIQVGAGRSTVISAGITGTSGFEKLGAGTLQLTGIKTYTGETIVSAGTLQLNSANFDQSVIRGTVTVNSGAILDIIGFDYAGLGRINGANVTALNVNGGTVNNSVISWLTQSRVTLTGGSMLGGSYHIINSTIDSAASEVTSTISSSLVVRKDFGSRDLVISTVDGAADVDLHISGSISQVGSSTSLTKNGAGTLLLSGQINYSGATIVNEGALALSSPILPDTSTVLISAGAQMRLNFTGVDVIDSLEIDGSGRLPAGIYDANHPQYGAFFTGTGALVIEGTSSRWISLADGTWSDSTNWENGQIAVGYDATATFQESTGVNVTLDSNRKIGHLVFDVSDYSLVGSGILSLESSIPPSIRVGAGRTANVSAGLAGSSGLEKNGAGRLRLSGVKSYTGITNVMEGTLELFNSTGGNSLIRGSLFISTGASVEITGGDGTGFGWFNPVNNIEIDGGTLHAVNSSHIGFGANARLNLYNGSSVLGAWQWNGDGGLSVATYGDATNVINGNLTLRADAGAVHSFYVDDGAATTDLEIGANLSDQWPEVWWVPASGLTKNGPGQMVLKGTNTYDGNTLINEGSLVIDASASMRFRPTANGQSNQVLGNTTSTLVFEGAINLDLSVANTTVGNSWNLINLSSFTENAPTLTPSAVTSSAGNFTEVSPGQWQLDVPGAKWVFATSTGTLSYQLSASDFDTWKSSVGLNGSASDDNDGDGLTNFQEYAFGLDPLSTRSVNAIHRSLDSATGTFSYTRRRTELTGLTYSVWYSTDLTQWVEDTSALHGIPSVNGDVESVTVTVDSSLLSQPKLFLRVRAQ